MWARCSVALRSSALDPARKEALMPRVLALVGAIALVVGVSRPALAGGKPIKAPEESPPSPVIYPAGELCGFDLLFEDILNAATRSRSPVLTTAPSRSGTAAGSSCA